MYNSNKLLNNKSLFLFRVCRIWIGHAITYTDFCEDIFGFCRIFLDLPADICHIDAQDLVIVFDLGSPQLTDNKIVSKNTACVLSEKRYDFELILSEVDKFVAHTDLVLVIVNHQTGSMELSRLGDLVVGEMSAGMADGCSNASEKFACAERFNDVIIGSCIQCFNFVVVSPIRVIE